MNLVEQAVFTSAETSRTAGYQLVARSCGISEQDARALSTWGPSHGALLRSGRQASSINFHPLPSGNYCVGRTTASGNEYSGRGTRIYTQCLVISPETLGHFSNNPFAVVRAASGSGLLQQHEKVPKTLEPASLVGRAPVIDPSLLSRARREFGPQRIACLVQIALQSQSMAIARTNSGDLAVGALLNSLPPQLRPKFSFSTGLRTSARRPFRLLVLGDDAEERRRACQISELTLVDFSAKDTMNFSPAHGWARAICQILETGRTSLLSRWFENLPHDLSVDQLNEMGPALLEELGSNVAPLPEASLPRSQPRPGTADSVTGENSEENASSSQSPPTRQLAHAAHSQFAGTSPAEQRVPGPSVRLAPQHPQVVACLETLDDLVYDAIKGNESALARLRTAWPQVKADLGDKLLSQSREQYLRYALQVWENCVETSGVRPTDKAVNALEVLCLLFDEV